MQTTFTIIALAFVLALHIIPAIIHDRAIRRNTKED